MTILLSFIITFFLIIFFIFTTKYTNLLDYPGTRKIHNKPIPLVGGLAIYFNLILFVIIFDYDPKVEFFVFISTFFLILGIIDDLKNLNVSLRIFIQFLISSIIIFYGLRIQDIGILINVIPFENFYVSYLFTLIAIIGLTNAINFIDGMDGLCSGIVLISLASIGFFIYPITILSNNLLLVIASSLLIFLFFNLDFFNYKKIFLGDSGSTLLGFLLACFLIHYSQSPNKNLNPILALWSVSLPIFDFLSVTIRRSFNKTSPFKPDKQHIHHILLDYKIHKKLILIFLLFYAALLSLIGHYSYKYYGGDISFFLFMFLFFIYFIFTIYFSKKTNN